jgi:hypothetical protein
MKTIPLDARVMVMSDVYVAGIRYDDGQPHHALQFYVVIEFKDGYRLRHERNFKGCVEYTNEDDEPSFRNVQQQAEASAAHLAQRIVQFGKINTDHWYEIDPAYGSEAYDASGTEYLRWFHERNIG